ncbi:MAG: cation diffusion facilitator family transporter [Actinomycetota bacterium]|nr:cation diffusion facilitator family transporter [Actinomycetota bacterium]
MGASEDVGCSGFGTRDRQRTDDHAGHHHGVEGLVTTDADRTYLGVAFGLIVTFMVFEVVAAVASHSLALLADAGHMLTDASALGAAIWALTLAARPASAVWTFGLRRAEILAAAANGVTLAVMAALVAYDAVGRLAHPPHVEGTMLVIVATVGVAVNLAATLVLARANRQSLNVEGAFRHVVTDLYGFVATAVAGVAVVGFGLRRADPVASLVVVALMARAAWQLLSSSGRILLQGTPDHVDLATVRRHMVELPGVVAVHELHAWTLSSQLPVLTAHVVVSDDCIADGGSAKLLDRLQDCLAGHFDVAHSTFQLEPEGHLEHERHGHS